MITMCLGLGEQDPSNFETEVLPNQPIIMKTLLMISLVCVPLMLFVKPIYENHKHKQSHYLVEEHHEAYTGNYYSINNGDTQHAKVSKKANANHSFSELFIHQFIETIEFVLGTVSNTASYLRLWALSLAHSQLAKVFFDNTIKTGLQSNSFLVVRIFCNFCLSLYSFSWVTLYFWPSQFQY
jgi:V-type H+-transporting ATPase subunit a